MIGKEGTYVNMAAVPMVEYVDVDNVPGGDWDITVSNKYSLVVGSRGVKIRTTGPLDIYGTISNITAESLNLVGKQELLINSDHRVAIRADSLVLSPGNGGNGGVLIDGQLGVKANLIVTGGAHIEGEMSYLHSTTPV